MEKKLLGRKSSSDFFFTLSDPGRESEKATFCRKLFDFSQTVIV